MFYVLVQKKKKKKKSDIDIVKMRPKVLPFTNDRVPPVCHAREINRISLRCDMRSKYGVVKKPSRVGNFQGRCLCQLI